MTLPLPGGLLFPLLGLLFGSLASVLIHRLPRGLPVLLDRSRCPSCETPLAPRDLLPILSWALAGGRCRTCYQPISWRYPLLELAMALLFRLAWEQGGDDPALAGVLALAGFSLMVIFLTDFASGIIPDALTLTLAMTLLAWRALTGGGWWDAALGATLAFGLAAGLRALYFRRRGLHGLGLGDVKFLAAAGVATGLAGLGIYLLLAGLIGLAFGLVWRAMRKGDAFPFGPALCLALSLWLFYPQGIAEISARLVGMGPPGSILN